MDHAQTIERSWIDGAQYGGERTLFLHRVNDNAGAAEMMSFSRAPLARRQRLLCRGVTAESIAISAREPFESRYCGALHLLIAHERLARRRGITTVDGVPASSRQNLSQTLTFVPAGCRFREWHEPDIPSRAIYIHIDPRSALMDPDSGIIREPLPPRLHFRSVSLLQTVLKLKAFLDEGSTGCPGYADALGIVLAHELLHSNARASARPEATRGGLAVWQRQRVAQYIEEHLAEPIPVAALAASVRLSRFHFCRSFRQSFGTSPHRYHLQRRVERAKVLLGRAGVAVTDIALDVGYQELSSFTAAFRRLVGLTPTGFRRANLPPRR